MSNQSSQSVQLLQNYDFISQIGHWLIDSINKSKNSIDKLRQECVSLQNKISNCLTQIALLNKRIEDMHVDIAARRIEMQVSIIQFVIMCIWCNY